MGWRRDEVGFTLVQLKLLQEIHGLAKQMERIRNEGRVHAVIAMIEELSESYISPSYLVEKMNLLFAEQRIGIRMEEK